LARSGVYLLTALLISTGAGIAVDDPSGRYDIKYEGHLDDLLACGGVVYIVSQGSTIHGDSTLGLRGDGKMIGFIKGGTFSAAITFRKKPAMFVKLDGCQVCDNLSGSFTATSSNGGFYRGRFTARRGGPADDEVDIDPIASDDPLAYHKTLYFDPELYWHENQFGKEKIDIYDINYSRDTVLMVGTKPFLWQWWL
jgi:hypothetical protein